MQPGRNDPCPCGSGKKYKKCCAAKMLAAGSVDVAEFLREARSAYDAGDYRRVLMLALSVIDVNPGNGEATHMAGVAYMHMGEWNRSLTLLEKASRLTPRDAHVHNNLAIALQNLGRHDEALDRCTKALEIDPTYADAHNNLARSLSALGRRDDAIIQYRNAIQYSPTTALFRYNLGSLFQSIPDRSAEAELHYLDALALDPTLSPALLNLGALYLKQKKPHQAKEWLLKAHQANPKNPEIMSNLGDAFLQLGDYESTLVWCRRAVDTAGFLPAYVNIGIALEKMGDTEGAIEAYRNLVVQDPSSALGQKNLIHALLAAGKLNEAYEWLIKNGNEDLISLVPFSESINIFQQLCDFPRLSATLSKFRSGIKNDSQDVEEILLLLNYDGVIEEGEIYKIHTQWGSQTSSRANATVVCDIASGRRATSGKIRIGYLSADFRRHSVGYFIRNVLANHDRECFEIFCYSNVQRNDDVTEFIKTTVDHYVEVAELNDISLARRIASDRIDILVDLSGHTSNNRISMLVFRPAPMQVSYLGYANTSGANFIDYWITDIHAHADSDEYHTEQLIKLPECFLCFGGFEERLIQERPPALDNHCVTFGSFNNLAKLSSATLQLWIKILKRVPNSRLLIKANWADSPHVKENIGEVFKRYNVDIGRLTLSCLTHTQSEHLDRYNEVDIALDPVSYNGTTTTCEALWMGVPIITLVGDSHRQRTSFTILKNIGVDDTIAWNEEQYVDMAETLAGDMARLTTLRRDVAKKIRNSILCNPARFVFQYEELLKRTWERRMADCSER